MCTLREPTRYDDPAERDAWVSQTGWASSPTREPMRTDNGLAARPVDRRVLVFGDGPVYDCVSRELSEGDCVVVEGADTLTGPIDAAVVSLENLGASACALAIDMFTVVEALALSQSDFPGVVARVVVVTPAPTVAVPERVGLRLAKTLALYLGAPSQVRFNVVQAANDDCPDSLRRAADLTMMLATDELDPVGDRVFRLGASPVSAFSLSAWP